jgi:glycosyltransferase involved in cell wall biosynthesis
LLGKFVAKKVIFTLHSNVYNDDKMNYLSQKLADGVILLNKNAEKKYKNIFKNTIVLGSIFAEGVDHQNFKKKKYIQKIENKLYLLVYAFDKVYREAKDVYGIDFILENISNIDDKYVVVILDIKGSYKTEINQINSNSIIYLNHEVDFLSLLSEIDIYVRPTTTDGSSVAVQEALMLGKKVLASDVVERPAEVTLYKSGDFTDFKEKLEHIKETEGFTPNSIDDYLAFCNQLLEN